MAAARLPAAGMSPGTEGSMVGAEMPALSLEHPVQGTHVGIVWMHRATFLLDP